MPWAARLANGSTNRCPQDRPAALLSFGRRSTMSPTVARTTLVVVVLGLVGLLGVRMLIGAAQWADCTGSYGSGAVLSFQHLGAAPSLGDCILHGLGRSAPPRSTAPPTTLPTPDTSLPTPEELYGAEAGAACRQQHETWSEVFNQL